MKYFITIVMLCGIALSSSAQEADLIKTADEITAEAKALYNSEWASWYGTDIFLEKCADKRGAQAGYLSYDDGKGLVNIFYSKDETPVVISTIAFGYDFDKGKYALDTTRRAFNKQEAELYTIRKAAIERMQTDTTFKWYKNSTLNPVPFIYKNETKAYVFTGTSISGILPLGNDYLIAFNKKNVVVNVTRLHNSYIPSEFNQTGTDSSKIIISGMHNHLKGKSPFITVTDVCTLMLYAPLSTLRTYSVISEKYVSIWDCDKRKLGIITRDAWDKISNDQKLKNALRGGR